MPQASSWSWLPRPVADGALEGAQRGVRDVADGDQAEPVQQVAWVFSPTPHSSPTSSGCRKEVIASGGTTTTPSGLARRLASLATDTDAATPTEQVMPCSSWTTARSCSAISSGLPSRRAGAADVEERLVERDRLDQRGDPAEDLHHRADTVVNSS